MQKRKIRNPTAIVNQLKKAGKAFFIFQTLYTKKIMTENVTFSFTAKTELKVSDLAFIGQVKRHAKSLDNIPKLTAQEVNYIEKNDLPEGVKFSNCYEIDLNAAFWNFAHQENFINEEIFKKGLAMPKKTRLVSLGALAKKITVMRYDGKEFMPIEFISSHETQGVFFRVAQLTSELMGELKFLAEDDFLFFWCDAIFIKSEDTFNLCCDYLEAMEYQYKSYKIDHVFFTDGQVNVFSKDFAQRHEIKKPFAASPVNRIFTFEPPKRKNNTYKFFTKPIKKQL